MSKSMMYSYDNTMINGPALYGIASFGLVQLNHPDV